MDKLLEIIIACGYQAYRNTLVGNQAPEVRDYFQRVTNPQPGDIVLEISNRAARPIDRVGRLISVGMEDPPNLVKEDGPSSYLEKVWRIQTFDDREFLWWNANFISLPETEGFNRCLCTS